MGEVLGKAVLGTMVGDKDGDIDGDVALVGAAVGSNDDEVVALLLGAAVGNNDGGIVPDGVTLGDTVVGDKVGAILGVAVDEVTLGE